ncbi:hypothetical protein FR483_N329L [Paramecium bursaria Chlorella virus FR483]|uniref:Uncharacterized protein N329L n=1 Tax=Paramecium bursaria Chlorella virus FR483 TaxID=399781 RepID=A7J733_PBCVF|nr:hypothetical protein FR483_N329L [Paramecium bursaria Chlorella virus FR483]ABT15614.1 hypothetical protein FR483_N329L [Paramecium bursaria Chlorella virus FR483]
MKVKICDNSNMNRAGIENILRPILQNLNVIGSRGPPRDWVFPAMLASVVMIALLAALLLFTVELVFYKSCPICGNQKKCHLTLE